MTVMAKNKPAFEHKKKNKHGKNKKKEFKAVGKRGRLVIRNLPFTCTEKSLKDYFAGFGEIIDINLLKRPDKKLTGCCFIEFTTKLSASKALQECNGKPFLGRPIYIDRAVSRDRYNNSVDIKDETESEEEEKDVEIKKESEDNIMDISQIKKEEETDSVESDSADIQGEKAASETKCDNEITDLENSKYSKKARLIVRNLSFKSTEENVREHFSKYGEVVDVTLLRRSDNKLVGCGFVQFYGKQSAAKAIHYTSGKPFLDRPIIVDWAVPKDKFIKAARQQQINIKKEIKDEPMDIDDLNIKKEEETEEKVKIKDELDRLDSEVSAESEDESEKDDDNDDNDDDDSENEDIKPKVKLETNREQKKQRTESNDISEGKTVFIKNVPFSVTNDELKECMEKFGPINYALVCIDLLTEHSKGTAFIKFKSQEDAEKCLQAGTELTLKGAVLDPHPALRRDEVKNKNVTSKSIKKDNRNLYLVKEGVILAGTPAAKGVSVSDMERRLQLERWKSQMLRNLNAFVSRDRLIVHNLPPSYDDKKLQNLFQTHAGHQAGIREARVMRNLRTVDEKGVGISKGYGFVSFNNHEDALRALRNINNNPDIFSKTKRPIVAFSIENRSVLNAKKKRLEKSKQRNPLCSEYRPDTDGKKTYTDKREQSKKGKRGLVKTMKRENVDKEDNQPNFAGVTAKPGSTKIRTKFHLRKEAQLHAQQAKKDKVNTKVSRKQRKMESERHQEKTQNKSLKKKKSNRDDVEFTQLVNKYKSQMMSEPARKKWYE